MAAASSKQWPTIVWLFNKYSAPPQEVWRTLIKSNSPTWLIKSLIQQQSTNEAVYQRVLSTEILPSLLARKDVDLLEYALNAAPWFYTPPPSHLTDAVITSNMDCFRLLLDRKSSTGSSSGLPPRIDLLREDWFEHKTILAEMVMYLVTKHEISQTTRVDLFNHVASYSDTDFFDWYCQNFKVTDVDMMTLFYAALSKNNLKLIQHLHSKKVCATHFDDAIQQIQTSLPPPILCCGRCPIWLRLPDWYKLLRYKLQRMDIWIWSKCW